MYHKLLFVCIALISILFSTVRSEVNDPDVTVLTESNFDDFINNNDISLVEFYAPWCGHCKALAPEYALAATELKNNKPDSIPLGKVDCTVETALASKYGIQGYPTLKVFRNGQPTDYQGGRTKTDIVSYMKKQSGPASRVINNADELKNLILSDPNTNYAVIGFFDNKSNSQLHSAFTLVSNKLRDQYIFGKVYDNYSLGKSYGVTDGTESVVAVLGDDSYVFDDTVNQNNLESFVNDKSIPLVGILTKDNGATFHKSGKPVVKLFTKLDTTLGLQSKQTKYYINRFKKLKQNDKFNDLVFVIGDKTNNQRQVDDLNGREHDYVLIVDDASTGDKYRLQNKAKDKFDIKKVESFLNDYVSGSIKPYVKSEDEPADNDTAAVKVLTGNNFNEYITDDVNAMIEFYAPWCGHCKALAPKYDELGQKYKDNDSNVVIGKLDATANDWPNKQQYQVTGYPTLYFKPANGQPIKYDGAREVSEMSKFIKQNSKNTGKTEL